MTILDLLIVFAANALYSGIYVYLSVIQGKCEEAKNLAFFAIKGSGLAIVGIIVAKIFVVEFSWGDLIFWTFFTVTMFFNSLTALFWNLVTKFCHRIFANKQIN
ncbi:MAG: hypothetical protein ACOZAO_03310 [Patescibacteria group bacterium]